MSNSERDNENREYDDDFLVLESDTFKKNQDLFVRLATSSKSRSKEFMSSPLGNSFINRVISGVFLEYLQFVAVGETTWHSSGLNSDVASGNYTLI